MQIFQFIMIFLIPSLDLKIIRNDFKNMNQILCLLYTSRPLEDFAFKQNLLVFQIDLQT